MKLVINIVCLTLLSVVSLAQPYGNEWINYSQKHLEFKITEEGIYSIDYNALDQALDQINANIDTLDPRNIQLFGRGEEIPIYIKGEADGAFNSNDYIEFYAKHNDGWLDSLIYDLPQYQSNPYYSLFNDTASYYLTWNGSTNNHRLIDETDTQFPTAAADYFLNEEIWLPNTSQLNYHNGPVDGIGKSKTKYVAGKGWFENYFDQNASQSPNTRTHAVASFNPYSAGPDATVKTVLASVGGTGDHQINIKYGSTTAATANWTGYALKKFNFTLPASQLGNSSTDISFEIPTLNVPTQKKAISHIYLKYPQGFSDLNNRNFQKIILPANTFKTKIEASNFFSGTAHFYDLTEGKRMANVDLGSGNINALAQAGGEKTCILFTQSSIQNITTFTPINNTGYFTDFSQNNAPTFIVVTHKKLQTSTQSYVSHRTSTGETVLTAYITEIYDQFAAGINKHPLALRNFCNWMLGSQNWTPNHLFIIGKSIVFSDQRERNNTANYAQNLVPSFGWPASDVAITSELNGAGLEPAIPTGRLSANTNSDVYLYLNKVKDYETASDSANASPAQWVENRLWRKNAIHFAGGKDASENNSFRGFLDNYALTLADTSFGGRTSSFSKQTSQVFSYSLADTIKALINNGISVISFFGHSSAGSFDISLDDPSTYNNKGKYPLFIANGCYSGDIHQPSSGSSSENFVLIEDKGAIGFIATSHLGISNYLNNYTSNLYQQFAKINYEKSIGECMQQTIEEVMQVNQSVYDTATCLEMSLHGDPSIVVNSHGKPDYEIHPKRVFFSPTQVTSEVDTFIMNIIISNLGRAKDDNLTLHISRKFPDATINDFDTSLVVPGPYYQDTIQIKFAVNLAHGIGLNQFEVQLDRNLIIDEIDNIVNNQISGTNAIDLWIRSSDLIPIYPYNYAVVPNKDITLKASTSDPFAVSTEYIFQISENDNYSSAYSQTVTSIGGVIEWPLDSTIHLSNLNDSTVYFWRCSPNHSNPDSLKWREHTFQIIEGKRGWGQDNFFQFKNDEFLSVEHNTTDTTFDFTTTVTDLFIGNHGNPDLSDPTYAELDRIKYSLNSVTQDEGCCYGVEGIKVAVIDSFLLEPWLSYYNGVGQNYNDFHSSSSCHNKNYKAFLFRTYNPTEMDEMITLLNDIPNGNHVVIWSTIQPNFENTSYWQPQHLQALNNLGSTVTNSTPSENPYIFYVKKGDLNTVKEEFGDSARAYISMTVSLENSGASGAVTSPLIGPSYSWGNLYWKFDDDVATDIINLEILDPNDNVVASRTTKFDSIINLNNFVDAQTYPYIKLRAYSQDDSLKTCTQFDRWHLLYDEIPELALNPIKGLSCFNNNIAEGENLNFAIAIENVSTVDMDSFYVSYYITDQTNTVHQINYPIQGKLKADSVLYDTISYKTPLGFYGKNNFWVDVNPEDNNWQLEQYHFNNVATKGFTGNRDNINPLLDVTFDGIHILDGDIVSANPMISIQLKDENPYLLLNSNLDTALFTVYLTNPENVQQRIYFTDGTGTEIMRWYKASAAENRFRIEYNPTLTQDGIYKLNVQGKDKSHNKSGQFDYSVTFEVIGKSSITNILNYPNPFTTSTRFVFTLTGSQIPDKFTIQILTVTGKVVREITKNELGNINIGRNISEYAWDGYDEYGDRLANGVYLYRVLTEINGEKIEHRATGADTYFTQGFSKMYLMR